MGQEAACTGGEAIRTDSRQMLGHILGQVFRLQEMVKPGSSGTHEAMRYKLILGFEDEISAYFDRSVFSISMDTCKRAEGILFKIWRDPRERENVNEYMLKERLRWAGIREGDDYVVLTAIRLEGRYVDLFRKIDPDGTRYQPSEFET